MPTYNIIVAGKKYTVEVPNPNERPVHAIVDGEPIEVEVLTQPQTNTTVAPPTNIAMPTPTTSATNLPTTGNPGEVTAPLPGTVVSIDVAPGDKVEYGQELCVLEAMKMNNPIRATQAGTVEKVLVRIGEQIQHGTTLVIIGD